MLQGGGDERDGLGIFILVFKGIDLIHEAVGGGRIVGGRHGLVFATAGGQEAHGGTEHNRRSSQTPQVFLYGPPYASKSDGLSINIFGIHPPTFRHVVASHDVLQVVGLTFKKHVHGWNVDAAVMV